MRIYYGTAGSTGTHFSERDVQLRVRQRLIHTVRWILKDRDWRSLPRGQADLGLLSRSSAAE